MEIPVEFEFGRGSFESPIRVAQCRLARVAIHVALVTASLACQGCLVVPVRAPTRTNGISGTMEKVNLNFIQVGKTTREDVTANLGGTDTGIKDKETFVGRWATSQWGVLWAVYGNNSSGGWNRGWARHNILIGFDDNDVVQQYHQFSDEDLVNQLSAWVAQGHGQPLDLSAPMEVRVGHRHGSALIYDGTLILENDSFAYREPDNHAKHDFKISPKQIKEISLTSIGHGDKSDPQFIHETIHFTGKTKVGGKMTIEVDVPTVLILVKYMAQTRPSHHS